MDRKSLQPTSNSITGTIGPNCSRLDKKLELKSTGVCLFRVNMSHSSINDLGENTQLGKDHNLKIDLDKEVGQIITKLKGMSCLNIDKSELLKIYNNLFNKNIIYAVKLISVK
tara:strand:- start:31 stop:369 length:339 start_codon:yes stop_codon:yes gene_type:complete